jgi:hypothetical protein
MPSPFPGMDPYIESPPIWTDFYGDLAYEIRAQLNRQIQPRYIARSNPTVTYEVVEVNQVRGIRPDVAVWQSQPDTREARGGAATLGTAPVESLIPLEIPLHLNTIEIRTAEQQLVTVIEILSPVNKRSGHDAYLEYRRKRRDLFRSGTHLIEIDLLRAGERLELDSPVPPAPYYVILSRVERHPTVEVWPIQLWDRLPVLPVPLLEPDPDATLDLAAAVSEVYERGAYAVQIDYQRPPPPPLSGEETAWMGTLLSQE